MKKTLYFAVSVIVLSLVLSNTALAVIDGGGTTGKIPKFTAPTVIGDSLVTEKDGKIGIGITTPAALLHVQGSGPTIRLTDPAGATVKIDTASGNLHLGASPSKTHLFIQSDGRVGIGTTQPREMLDVVGGAYFRGNSTRVMFGAKQNGTGDIASFIKGNDTVMLINNAGNVGIGTTIPAGKLHVTGGDAIFDSRLSVNNNLVTQLEGGLYYGRVGVRENPWVVNNLGAAWTARESVRQWRGVALSSDGKYQTAVVDGGRIYTSYDYGVTWTVRGNSFWRGVALSSDGKYQTAVDNEAGRIETSYDYGATWTIRNGNAFNGVALSSDGKYQTAAGANDQIYTSYDYGVTWTARDSLRDWRGVALSSDGKYQTAVSWGGKIYTSYDYGITWTARESNRQWMNVTMSSDGTYQTAVVDGGQIYTSYDSGITWTARESSRSWMAAAISADGKYQAAVVNAGQLYISSDYGATWATRGGPGGFSVAMSSDGKYVTTVAPNRQIYTFYADSHVDGNVGIGGDVAITTQGNGVVLRATDGANCFRVTVNNAGVLSTAAVTCP